MFYDVQTTNLAFVDNIDSKKMQHCVNPNSKWHETSYLV